MAMRITRRRLLEAAGTATVAGTLSQLPQAALAQETESHGLSTFGELALPADFPHFAYVNPKAPKGGSLTIQIKPTPTGSAIRFRSRVSPNCVLARRRPTSRRLSPEYTFTGPR